MTGTLGFLGLGHSWMKVVIKAGMLHFYTSGSLTFSGVLEMEHWHEMDYAVFQLEENLDLEFFSSHFEMPQKCYDGLNDGAFFAKIVNSF